MKNTLLTRELVQHIFISIGLSAGNFSKLGLSSIEFQTDKTIDIEYEDNSVIKHKTYAANLVFDSTNIKFFAVDLSVDGIFEAALAVRMNDLPIHTMRLCYEAEEPAQFCVAFDSKFLEADLFVQGNLMLGIERMLSWGLSWGKLDDFEDLRRAVLSICN